MEAVASGEIDLGLVNHYYLYLVQEEQPGAPVANHFLPGDDPGALVSAAGVGVLENADNRDDAESFVEFLLSDEGQRFYTERGRGGRVPARGRDTREGGPAADRVARRAGHRVHGARRRARDGRSSC